MIEKPGAEAIVHIDAPIPQKRPVLAHSCDGAEVAVDDEQMFVIVRRLRDQLAGRFGDE
jgi:hypothetical protein